mgnify:CR=1
ISKAFVAIFKYLIKKYSLKVLFKSLTKY